MTTSRSRFATGAADIVEAIRRYENGERSDKELHDFLELNDPDFQLNRYEEIPTHLAKLEAANAHIATLYARWEELQALADAE